jgi:hypothetical protein
VRDFSGDVGKTLVFSLRFQDTLMEPCPTSLDLFIVCHGCVSRVEVGNAEVFGTWLTQPWHGLEPFDE